MEKEQREQQKTHEIRKKKMNESTNEQDEQTK